jgi:threonine synthase
VLELFDQQFKSLKNVMSSYSITDEETKATISQVYSKYHYLPDPHGAVGYLSLKKYLAEHPQQKGIFLETAHPVKFYDVVEPITGEPVAIPDSVKSILNRKKQSKKMEANYNDLKNYLLG